MRKDIPMSSKVKAEISNGKVIKLWEWEDGSWERESLDGDEAWTYKNKKLIKTELDDGEKDQVVYSETNQDGIYISSEDNDIDDDDSDCDETRTKIKVKIKNGKVTKVWSLEDGEWERESVEGNEAWSYKNNKLIKTELEDGRIEREIYTDQDKDGVFTLSAKKHTDSNSDDASDADDSVDGTDDDDIIRGKAGSDSINGGKGDDELYGGSGDDELYGNDGDDQVYGGSGNDLIIGGSGKGDDTYDGGEGTDTIKYTSATAGIKVNLRKGCAASLGSVKLDRASIGKDTIKDVENIVGSSYRDKLTGNNSNNIIKGLAGNDKIKGLGGNDRIYGGGGDDLLISGKGKNKVWGGEGSDTFKIRGGSGYTIIKDFVDEEDRIGFGGKLTTVRVVNNLEDALIYNGSDLMAVVKNASGKLSEKNGFWG